MTTMNEHLSALKSAESKLEAKIARLQSVADEPTLTRIRLQLDDVKNEIAKLEKESNEPDQ